LTELVRDWSVYRLNLAAGPGPMVAGRALALCNKGLEVGGLKEENDDVPA
jgi:hypothetical protein